MIVYSQNYVVFPPLAEDQLTLNNPLVGWRNIVTGSLLVADTEQDGFPVANLATPVTYQRWRGEFSLDTQYITLTNGPLSELDYLAVAGHNFATGEFPVQVEGALNLNSDGDLDWVALTPEVVLPNDGPLLFRFELATYLALRLVIGVGVTDPYAAVMYAGELLVLPRRIYVGHHPITLNKKTDLLNGFSETGQFLGRIVKRQSNGTSINMLAVSPSFYRSDMKPWVVSAETLPFFFAWRPHTYPREVGYCWATSDGVLVNERPNGSVQLSLSLQGLV